MARVASLSAQGAICSASGAAGLPALGELFDDHRARANCSSWTDLLPTLCVCAYICLQAVSATLWRSHS